MKTTKKGALPKNQRITRNEVQKAFGLARKLQQKYIEQNRDEVRVEKYLQEVCNAIYKAKRAGVSQHEIEETCEIAIVETYEN